MSRIRVAFMGFRHGHIRDIYNRLQERNDAEIVAACEEDAVTRRLLEAEATIKITHDSFDKMLRETQPEAIAVGDYYAKRGGILIRALESGRHVISDKPICTGIPELEAIEKLASEKKLSVGCQLDMRDAAPSLALRSAIQGGEIGSVHAISFGGQHPLAFGTRPGWYFEPGKHGGTINDIAIHAINCIERITAGRFKFINGARNWNARVKEKPHFKDAAQMMLTMEDGCGVLGDVSYLMPDSFGYANPFYWRFLFWGSDGLIDAAYSLAAVNLYKNGEKSPRALVLPKVKSGEYLDAFLNEIRGVRAPDELSTEEVLRSSRTALLIQRAADQESKDLNFALH